MKIMVLTLPRRILPRSVHNRTLFSSLVFSLSVIFCSSFYVTNAFGDDNWSDITKRQQLEQEKAIAKYQNKYQHANMDQSKVNWSGLTSITTDETSRGREYLDKARVSLENAIGEFDRIHAISVSNIQTQKYQGLESIPTDTDGRDRDTMIEQARQDSLKQADQIVKTLGKMGSSYATFEETPTTDYNAKSRQDEIEKTWNKMDKQAGMLVNKSAKVDLDYANLKSGPTTNTKNIDRHLDQARAYALEKAIMKYEHIHAMKLSYLKSNYYGLNNTPTDMTGKDRGEQLEKARTASLEHALRVYNAYYPATKIKNTQ